MTRKIPMVGESIQTWARSSLVAALEIRRLELVVAINFECGQYNVYN